LSQREESGGGRYSAGEGRRGAPAGERPSRGAPVRGRWTRLRAATVAGVHPLSFGARKAI